MLAGGIAGGLFGIGWGILGVVTVFLLVAVAFGFLVGALLGGADITGGLGAVVVVLGLVAFAVGIVLVVLSVVLSLRILRKGGINKPKAVTWLGLGIALVVNSIAQAIASPYIQAFSDSDAPGWARVVVSIVLGLVAVGVGIGVWLLLAHAFRGATQTAVAAPVAPGVVPPNYGGAAAPPAAPVAAPEPPTTTIQNPPPAPPAPPAA